MAFRQIPVTLMLLYSVVWLGLAPVALADEAYRWVDAQGRTVFGSNPPAGAKAVEKIRTNVLSRYSSDKMLARLGRKAATKQASPGNPEPADFNYTPSPLQQEKLTIERNDLDQITVCTVTVLNPASQEARDVSVAFEFNDGTLVPAIGPDTIAANATATYSLPPDLLPLRQPASEEANKDELPPEPRVIIHGTM